MNTGEDAPPATDLLEDVIANLGHELADVPQSDQVTYTHVQHWSLEQFDPAPSVIAQDVRTQWHPDRSAVVTTTEIPQPSGASRAILQAPPSQPVLWPPGTYSTLINEPPSTKPNTLRQQLTLIQPSENGSVGVLRAISSLMEMHHFTTAQRLAVLRTLTTLEGLTYRGAVTDRAGRPGSAVAVDSPYQPQGQTRDVLIIDNLGKILSHERMFLTPPERLNLPKDTVAYYALFLDSSITLE